MAITVAEYIKQHDCCPKCGGRFGVYTKVRSKGAWNDTTTFDGEKENTEMLDSFVDTWESAWIYCAECNKPLAKRV